MRCNAVINSKLHREAVHRMTSEQHLFDLVKTGFTDGENYDKNRPDYVPETVNEVVRLLTENHPEESGNGECDILELGAGTGKLTTRLYEQLPKDRKFITSEPMVDFLDTLKNRCPSVDARQFSCESIPLPDNSVQGIVAAQCFHWFANQTAVDEIVRVLKPQGNLVLLWNVRDTKVPWIKSSVARVQQHLNPGEPQYNLFLWEKFLNSYTRLKLKSRKNMDYPVFMYSKDELVQQCTSLSMVSRLSEEERKKTLHDIRQILDSDEETKDKDSIPLDMYTDVVQYVKC